MTVWAVRGSVLAVVLAAGLFSWTAHSQGPLKLLPTVPADPAPALEDVAPADETRSGGIRVNRLEDTGAGASGLRAPSAQGLSASMWAGTSAESARQLLAALPARFQSLHIRDLVAQLLVTTALAPEGAGDAFGHQRVAALLRIGAIEDAERLLYGLPDAQDKAGQWIANDLAFLNNRTDQGCAQALDLQLQLPGQRANRILAACHAIQGNGEAADRAFRFLAEEGEGDRLLRALARAVGGDVSGVDWEEGALTPVHFALAKAAGLAPEPSLLHLAPPEVQYAFAMSDSKSLPDKLAAVEAAVASGTVSSAVLAALYDAADTGDRLQQAAEADPLSLTPLDRAALFQAIGAGTSPVLVLQATAAGYPRLASAVGEEAAARLYAPVILSVDPRPELAWASPTVLRILAHLHEAPRFRGWYLLGRTYPQQVPAERMDVFADAYAIVQADEAAVSSDAAVLRHALGQSLSPQDEDALLAVAATAPSAVGDAPSAALAAALERAVATGRTAEAVLLTAIGLAPGEGALPSPPEASSPQVVSGVETLAQLGFAKEARALAMSAAVPPLP